MLLGLVLNSVYSSQPILISERIWHGEYSPETNAKSIANWGMDIKTSTALSPSSEWTINKLVYSWAIFNVHVHPAWTPFQCTITKQVCMMGTNSCENQTKNYLFQNDGTLDDNASWRAGYTYNSLGDFPITSHLYMDRCGDGSDRFNAHSVGIIKIRK